MNLKSEAHQSIKTRRKELLKELAELDKHSELAEKLPEDYPIPFSTSAFNSSIYLTTWQDGASYDMAALLSAEYGLKFRKCFY